MVNYEACVRTDGIVTPKSDFKFWFRYNGRGEFSVVLNDSEIGAITRGHEFTAKDHITIGVKNISETEIVENFDHYISERPEAWLSLDSELLSDITESETALSLKRVINGIICGLYYIKYDDESARKYADRLISWLSDTDFYTAPASTVYHDSFPGGLMIHTLKVIASAIELLQLSKFKSVTIEDAVLTALVHDFCKINFYETYTKNVKDDATGVWNRVEAYRCKGSSIPLGHGVTSMFIAQRFFKLSVEQALAIRWHMGEHNLADNESHDLMDANENYPLVMLLQIADRMAIMRP